MFPGARDYQSAGRNRLNFTLPGATLRAPDAPPGSSSFASYRASFSRCAFRTFATFGAITIWQYPWLGLSA